nr:DUF1289 domain-containing protein [Betaproteobacteria bacterium]
MSTLASPCVSVCRMDPLRQLCEGCLRTLDEIAAWGTLSEAAISSRVRKQPSQSWRKGSIR